GHGRDRIRLVHVQDDLEPVVQHEALVVERHRRRPPARAAPAGQAREAREGHQHHPPHPRTSPRLLPTTLETPDDGPRRLLTLRHRSGGSGSGGCSTGECSSASCGNRSEATTAVVSIKATTPNETPTWMCT